VYGYKRAAGQQAAGSRTSHRSLTTSHRLADNETMLALSIRQPFAEF